MAVAVDCLFRVGQVIMHFILRVAACGAMALLVPLVPASATIFTATDATIARIWAKARSGDTIRMIGKFGYTRLQNKVSATAVTLDASKATFSDTLNFTRVDGVHVIGGKFDISGGTLTSYAVNVYGGNNVWFDKTTILGVGNEKGIGFNGTTNVRVTNSSFTGLRAGIGLTSVTGGFLSKNKFLAAASDGIDIGDSHNVSATFNSCSGSVPAFGAHPDCIQLWSTTGQPLQSDNSVTDNYATGATQGFTSFSGGGGGLRISFLRNKVFSSFTQGVACYGCIDSNISYNSVKTMPGSRFLTTINVVGGNNNTVLGNTVGPGVGLTHDPSTIVESSAFGQGGTVQIASVSASMVTEPGTWAMLLAGFGVAGLGVRRRGRYAVAA